LRCGQNLSAPGDTLTGVWWWREHGASVRVWAWEGVPELPVDGA